MRDETRHPPINFSKPRGTPMQTGAAYARRQAVGSHPKWLPTATLLRNGCLFQ